MEEDVGFWYWLLMFNCFNHLFRISWLGLCVNGSNVRVHVFFLVYTTFFFFAEFLFILLVHSAHYFYISIVFSASLKLWTKKDQQKPIVHKATRKEEEEEESSKQASNEICVAAAVRIVNAGLWAFCWAFPLLSSPSSSPLWVSSCGSSG